jgi:hypothetical protein
LSPQPAKRRRRIRWLVVPLVEVIVLAVGGPFVFIHCIEGTPPTKLSLPSTVMTQGTSGSSDSGSTTAVPSLAGTSHEGAGSVVGYRLEEVLVGQSTTAVGGTKKVWGPANV